MSAKKTIIACGLWVRHRDCDGEMYMVGRMGPLRVLIRPVMNARPGQPAYTLEYAETENTVKPGEGGWLDDAKATGGESAR